MFSALTRCPLALRPAETGVPRSPAANRTGVVGLDRRLELVPSLTAFFRAARPRRSRGLNTSLRLDCRSSKEKTIKVSMNVGGTNAHQAPVRTDPHWMAQ